MIGNGLTKEEIDKKLGKKIVLLISTWNYTAAQYIFNFFQDIFNSISLKYKNDPHFSFFHFSL